MKFILRIMRRTVLFLSKIRLDFHLRYWFCRIFRGSVKVLINGYKMELNLRNDLGISKDLFIFKKREHLTVDYLFRNSILQKGDVVLDIGANIGYYVLLESIMVGESGQVYAIEPVIKNYQNLLKNIAINNSKNIKSFNLAAGSHNGIEEIYVADKGNISSFLPKGDANFVEKQKIQLVRIDDFIKDQNLDPVLVRMDVEGFETEIIKGMENLLNRKPKLLIEIHPNIADKNDLQDMLLRLKNKGYSRVVEIRERNELWMNYDGSVIPILDYLTRLIGDQEKAVGPGGIKNKTIDELINSLDLRGSAFHALIS